MPCSAPDGLCCGLDNAPGARVPDTDIRLGLTCLSCACACASRAAGANLEGISHTLRTCMRAHNACRARTVHRGHRGSRTGSVAYLRPLDVCLRRAHVLRVHSAVMEQLTVPHALLEADAIESGEHDRDQSTCNIINGSILACRITKLQEQPKAPRTCTAVTAPAVHVQLLAAQHTLHAVLGQPMHSVVGGHTPIDDRQV